MNNPKSNNGAIVAILVIVMILIGGVFGIILMQRYYNDAIKTPSFSETDQVTFTVEDGESGDQVLENLINSGLIREDRRIAIKIYFKQTDPEIQAGTFTLAKNLTVEEILLSLKNAKSPEVWITFTEGLRMDEYAKVAASAMNQAGNSTFSEATFNALTEDKEFIGELGLAADNLEGYLFPDKYQIAKDATERDMIAKLVANFYAKAGDLTYEQLIIASLIEREGYNEDDRGNISGVIQNRLQIGMKLDIDAGFLYYKKDWKHEIYISDKDEDQPYNMYLYGGLPPTPICNPGLESIQAAKNPISNDYYYYMHTPDGTSYFSETYEEHVSNVNRYLR